LGEHFIYKTKIWRVVCLKFHIGYSKEISVYNSTTALGINGKRFGRRHNNL
jgi:hypothetical protein